MKKTIYISSKFFNLILVSSLGLLGYFLTGCTSHSKILIAEEAPDTQNLVIVGVNDIHGALLPESAKTRDKQAAPYSRGGAAIFASHLKILRETFKDRVLVIDAGDEFQGSIESNLSEGAPMVTFLNSIGLNAAAVGNHEFDFGPLGPEGTPGDVLGALKARTSEAHYPYLSANIIEKSTHRPPEIPNFFGHKLIQVGKLKVGIIGLTTRETPVTTRPVFVKTLQFTDLSKAAVKESEFLKKEGAQVILLTAHVGLNCEQAQGVQHQFRKITTFQGHCDSDAELVQLLKSLPKYTVDAVISGHSHKLINHFIEGVPVIQGETRFHYYNIIHLTYDFSKSKIVPDKTQIEGPIPICEKFFSNQQNCDGNQPAPLEGRGNLVKPTLCGHTVYEDAQTTKLLEPIIELTAKEKAKILAQADRPLTHNRLGESELGNLFADAIREKLHCDFAFINGGGIRAPIEQGPITFGDLFRTAPFDNFISEIKLTGKELNVLIRILMSGERGFFQISGAQVRVIGLEHDAPGLDLNGDKKIEAWEINRLLEVSIDGKPIDDSKFYRVGTVDFLVQGGDNLGWFMKQIPNEKINLLAGPIIREVVDEHLRKLKVVNSEANPLISVERPRIKQEAAPRKPVKKRARHRRRK